MCPGNVAIKLLERNLARFGDHVVDRQFDKAQSVLVQGHPHRGSVEEYQWLFRSSSF